jgi:hypothetical protein
MCAILHCFHHSGNGEFMLQSRNANVNQGCLPGALSFNESDYEDLVKYLNTEFAPFTI